MDKYNSMPADHAKIIDNPSQKKLIETLTGMETLAQLMPVFESLGMGNANLVAALQQLPHLREQAHILSVPDQFNAHFANVGWIGVRLF